MNRKLVIGSVASTLIIAAAAGAIYASPWWVLHEIREAAEDRDIDALAEHVDTKAVRQSVRLAMGFAIDEAVSPTSEKQNNLAEGARQIAGMAMDPLADLVSSPTILMGMLISGRLSHALVPTAPSPALLANPSDWNADVHYVNWSTVLVQRKDAPGQGAFVLRRHGLLDWKLSGFQLPNR